MHCATSISLRSTSVFRHERFGVRKFDHCTVRCSAQNDSTDLDRRSLLITSGGLLLSSLAVPDPSLADKLEITLPPEKLSIGQIQGQRQAVRDRAEKKLFETLTPEDAPYAMRLVFNDAGTYDYTTRTGGLDGSIVLDEELNRSENSMLKPLVSKYKEIKQEVDSENAADGQGPISWADLIVLGARVAVRKEWVKQRRTKVASDQDAVFVSQAFGAPWPVKIGRLDSGVPGPAGKIPQLDASVDEIKTYLLQLGAKPEGGFAYKPPFYERPGFVMYTAAQADPLAAEEYLATDPGFAVWKKEYDKSKKTITRTNYEVDFITYFDRLTSLGAKFDPLAYLKPVNTEGVDETWFQETNEFSSIPAAMHVESRKTRRVARVLHERYEKEVERWRNYETLFAYLAFAVLFLTVLYLQSNAHTTYQVQSSIQSIAPNTDTMDSADAVLQWIETTLKGTWKDPVCGDGVCESPFEFASYGRFGCRADCGKLPEIQNLTTLQIDLYYNFRHPANSISSTELMSQASWNLCPKNGAPHGKDCYFTSAQRFDDLEGEVHVTLDDVPDGEWEVQLKRDYFNKVRGAVRVLNLVKEQAAWDRKYGAYLAALADQDFEINLLEATLALAETTAYDYTASELKANFTSDYNDLVDALSDGVITQSDFDTQNVTLHETKDFITEQYRRATCLCIDVDFETDCQGDLVGAFEAEMDDSGPLSQTELCQKYKEMTDWSHVLRLDAVRRKLSVERSGGSGDFRGKIGTRASKKTEQKAYIRTQKPELFDWIFTKPVGTTPETDTDLTETKYDVLAKYFSDGPTGFLDPSVLTAQVQFTNNYLQTANLTALHNLANQRVAEIQRQKEDTLQLPQVVELVALYDSVSSRFDDEMLPAFVEYNQVTWNGGEDTYLTCNLQIRGPEYIGQCTDSISCTRESNTVPYECSASFGLTSDECNSRCAAQEDCISLCECSTSCNPTQYCRCEACTSLTEALRTMEYQSIQDLATGSNVPLNGRRLNQDEADSITEHLLNLSAGVTALRTGQADLETQVLSLESEVKRANALAEQRAEDNSLGELINQGREEISLGQESVEGLLEVIIGKQNETLEAVQEATETVAALEEMTEKSLEAQSAIQLALREQMNAIKVAYQQNLITLDQAAELWKLARRERLVSDKTSHLSTYRCFPEMVVNHEFIVDNYFEDSLGTSRRRYIGLTNRIIAGMLVHSTRTIPAKCPESRFKDLVDECTGGISTGSYGVDPVFKSGTTMYNADFDNEESVTKFYNCSMLIAPSYERINPYSTSLEYVNQAPFCIELFNMRNLPYGFRSFPLRGKTNGFPFWFDINLSEHEADLWYRYLQEGLFVDASTKLITVEMVVHNAELRVFGYVQIRFDFTPGGSIKVTNRISTTKVELYETSRDFFRLTLEVILTGIVSTWLMYHVWRIYRSIKEQRSLNGHLGSIWRCMDFTLSLTLFISIALWWDHVIQHANTFKIDINYQVYTSLNPDAAYLQLANNGEGLRSINDAIEAMGALVDDLVWYNALNGFIALLLIIGMLKKMDFQPRLGVVTRSIALAGSDLLHFSVVSGLVFFGYAMMAHLIFGSSILAFSSLGKSVNTCFEILLGDISIASQLKELTGLQSFTGVLFFWSFEIVVYLVLLNFLLAIIVDAFSVVKETTSETTGMPTELLSMFMMKWRNLKGWILDRHFIPYETLGAVLKNYSGPLEDKRIGKKSSTQNNRITIQGEAIDARVLKAILRRSFAESAGVGLDATGAYSSFSGSPADGLPNEVELNQIVEELMTRFGSLTELEEVPKEADQPDRNELYGMISELENVVHEERNNMSEVLKKLSGIQEELLGKFTTN
eukprot:g5138.t1